MLIIIRTIVLCNTWNKCNEDIPCPFLRCLMVASVYVLCGLVHPIECLLIIFFNNKIRCKKREEESTWVDGLEGYYCQWLIWNRIQDRMMKTELGKACSPTHPTREKSVKIWGGKYMEDIWCCEEGYFGQWLRWSYRQDWTEWTTNLGEGVELI